MGGGRGGRNHVEFWMPSDRFWNMFEIHSKHFWTIVEENGWVVLESLRMILDDRSDGGETTKGRSDEVIERQHDTYMKI